MSESVAVGVWCGRGKRMWEQVKEEDEEEEERKRNGRRLFISGRWEEASDYVTRSALRGKERAGRSFRM